MALSHLVSIHQPFNRPVERNHRLHFRSGSAGRPLWTAGLPGQICVPTVVADLDGDGADETAILSGDVLDLSVTIFNGSNGTALWSHRILSPHMADYTRAIPRI